jgi:hypothetical protein
MTIDTILDAVRTFPGVLVFSPGPGDGTPEIAWGDHFVYHAPDGRMPHHEQPYATVVTKDYPGDTGSRLGAGRWRVNIHVLRSEFEELTGHRARDVGEVDFAATDVVLPHPVYGQQGMVCVVNPGELTTPTVLRLLREAHGRAVDRHARRADDTP